SYTTLFRSLSLLEFEAIQYTRKGNAIADEEQLSRLRKVPKREFMRRGINQHTLEKICARQPVRAIKLAKCLSALNDIAKSNAQRRQRCGRDRDRRVGKECRSRW